MGTRWKSTKIPGVRYREHPNRKHGLKPDRYFTIRYQREGIRKEEGLGWASEGWTIEKASITLAELKKGHITGEGPSRLEEKREKAKIIKDQERVEKERTEREAITFSHFC